MDYISTTEAGSIWGLTSARVRTLAREGRIEGACFVGGSWLIPAAAKKPLDGRTRASRLDETKSKNFPLLLFSKSTEGDLAKNLGDDERRLLAAQEAVASCQFAEAIVELEDLANNSADVWVKAGALHNLCLCCLALGASSRFSYYAGKLANLTEQKTDEHGMLHLVASDLETYYQGTEAFLSRVPVQFDSQIPEGFWAFLASRSSYVALVNCMKGNAPGDVLPFEIVCRELESRGFLYAAMLTHLSLAVICFFLEDMIGAKAHLFRAGSIGHEKDYLLPLAIYSPYLDKHLTGLLATFPEEFSSRVLDAGNQVHQGYQAVVRASGESHIFSDVDKADFEYIALAIRGLTNKEIAAMKGLSTVTVSKRFSSICQKLSVGSKRELVAIAKSAIAQYNTNPPSR